MARILIASYGLAAHNSRLMPWRTVLEVAQGLQMRGHDVLVLSVADRNNLPAYTDGDRVVTLMRQDVCNMRSALDAALGSQHVDVVFLPVSWSGNTMMRRLLDGIGTVRIGYLPGSAFELRYLARIVGKMPLCSLLPYLVQAVYPQCFFKRALARLNLRALITNSNYSTHRLANATGIPVVTIAPGRDSTEAVLPTSTPAALLAPAPYFLFMGPPHPIRGTYVLLDAYSRIANEAHIPPLLCLFRSDAHLNIPAIRSRIEKRWAHDKIYFAWTSLSPPALQAHIQMAAAIIMPFLIVPSEIPLAVYEAAGMGKTVITTGPNGTGDFVTPFGEIVPPGNVGELAAAMRKVALQLASRKDYDNTCARATFRALDDWQSVSDRWGAVAGYNVTHSDSGTKSNTAVV